MIFNPKTLVGVQSTPVEPEYRFVKGQGWIPSIHKTATGIIGLYRVTVSDEPPQKGDYYGNATHHSEESFLDEISKGQYVRYFERTPPDLQVYSGAPWQTSGIKLYRLILEPL
jgi:hypothetical protein